MQIRLRRKEKLEENPEVVSPQRPALAMGTCHGLGICCEQIRAGGFTFTPSDPHRSLATPLPPSVPPGDRPVPVRSQHEPSPEPSLPCPLSFTNDPVIPVLCLLPPSVPLESGPGLSADMRGPRLLRHFPRDPEQGQVVSKSRGPYCQLGK